MSLKAVCVWQVPTRGHRWRPRQSDQQPWSGNRHHQAGHDNTPADNAAKDHDTPAEKGSQWPGRGLSGHQWVFACVSLRNRWASKFWTLQNKRLISTHPKRLSGYSQYFCDAQYVNIMFSNILLQVMMSAAREAACAPTTCVNEAPALSSRKTTDPCSTPTLRKTRR